MEYCVYCDVTGCQLVSGSFSQCYEYCERKGLYIVERLGESGTVWSVK